MSKGTVNKVILVGRLGSDPEMRYSPNGTAIAKFSIATDDRVPAGEGNWQDHTEWHRIVCFGKLAERCGNYLNKGKQVFIEGSLRTNQWEDNQGVKRYTTEVIARDMEILSSGGGQSQNEGESGNKPESRPRGSQPPDDLPPPPAGGPEDDIPF